MGSELDRLRFSFGREDRSRGESSRFGWDGTPTREALKRFLKDLLRPRDSIGGGEGTVPPAGEGSRGTKECDETTGDGRQDCGSPRLGVAFDLLPFLARHGDEEERTLILRLSGLGLGLGGITRTCMTSSTVFGDHVPMAFSLLRGSFASTGDEA